LLEPDQEWCTRLALDGDTLVAVLPLIITPHRTPMGRRHLLTTTEPLDDMLIAEGYETTASAQLIRKAFELFPRSVALEFRRLPASSPTNEVANRGLPGCRVLRVLDEYGSYLTVDGNYTEYLSGLSKKMRENLRRSNRKLGKEGDVSVEIVSGKECTGEMLEEFLVLEASGYKGGDDGLAMLSSERKTAFARDLAARFVSNNWLEWHFLRLKGKPVAAQFALIFGHTMVTHKMAHDESLAKMAPGNILREITIERAFALPHITTINSLTDLPWHRTWRMERRPHYNVTFFPGGVVSWLFGYLPQKLRLIASNQAWLKALYHRLR
jgi:CelD/BcsL family acetyltransferase involved in cellulose biosynthesis